MATDFSSSHSRRQEERQAIRGNWCWFLALGAGLILAGLLAITYPVMATLTTVTIFGIVLLVSGGMEIFSAIWAARWRGVFLHVLIGLMYLFVGVCLVEHPALLAEGYTLLLAMFFIAGGVVRILFSVSHRFSGWVWAVVNGGVTFILGILIWRQWPLSGLWVIGTFVGIDLIFNGMSWFMLGLAVRDLPASRNEPRP